jgi:hypothetical protein
VPPPRSDPRWLLPALVAAGLAVSGATALKDIQPNDEGLMLRAAARIAAGEVPYRDFWWFYPPGQPYLLALLHDVFGPSLVVWRAVRVLADATVAALAYALARRRAGRGPALAAWLVAACAMAWPSGPHPFPVALACALGALLALESRPALAGAPAGLCAAWRIEFAVFLVAGAAAGLADRRALRLLAAAALTALALYAPVVAAAGLRPAWNLLVDYPLTDFRDYQALPFPLRYDGPLNTSSLRGFATDSLEPLLLFHLPLVLVAGLAAGLASLRDRRPLTVATAVLAVGMLGYLLVRADAFHTAPLAVLVAILGAWALGGPRAGWRIVPLAVCAVALAYGAVEGLDRRRLVVREATVPLALPVADGVRVPPRQAAELEAAVRAVQRLVPPGRPVYVTGRRADIVTSGHPLLNVLAGRPNPTRYDIAAPGVVTSATVQREIVAALERTRTPVVVRWTAPVTAAQEPNAAGRSSGVRLLDAYLARRYAPARRVGAFVLLTRRP